MEGPFDPSVIIINQTGRADFAERFGRDSVAVTLGVTGIIKTADNKLVIGQLQTHHPKKGGIHVVGGLVEPEDITDEPPYLKKAIMREIEEEIGIEENEWQLDKFLGVVDSKTERSVDVIFLANTQLTEKEIRNRETDEEVSVKFIPDTASGVRKTLLNFVKTATDQGLGALFLYGKQTFGPDWAQFVTSRIKRRTKVYSTFDDEQNEKANGKITVRVGRI